MYWDTEVGQAPEGVQIFDLAQFTKQQAHDFFERRFQKHQTYRQKAHQLLDQVSAANQPATKGGGKNQITYHPYIVAMVASSVEQDIERLPETQIHDARPSSSKLMLALLREKCVREQTRRKLETPPEEQLAAFEAIAIDCINRGTGEFDEELCIIAGFRDSDRARLKDHPLISAKSTQSSGIVLQFRYDFFPQILTARYLVRAIIDGCNKLDPLTRDAIQLMEREGEAKGVLLEHMCSIWDLDDFAPLAKCYARVPKGMVRSFLFHFGRALLSDREPSVNKTERANQLFSLLGGQQFKTTRTVRDMYLRGTVEKLDLSGMCFEQCTFVDAVFADCIADENTRFVQCQFLGEFDIIGADRKSWSKVKWPADSESSASVRLVWDSIMESGGGPPEDVARDLTKLGLSKFWHNGRLKKSIAKSDWNKGLVGRHGYGNKILKAMVKVGLVESIHISGTSEGGYGFVSNVSELQQFMDNGLLTGKVRELFEELKQ